MRGKNPKLNVEIFDSEYAIDAVSLKRDISDLEKQIELHDNDLSSLQDEYDELEDSNYSLENENDKKEELIEVLLDELNRIGVYPDMEKIRHKLGI